MKNNLSNQELREFFGRICLGNDEAFYFVNKWCIYSHRFDDLVDEEFSVVKLIETNTELHEVLTCPFFKDHASKLLPTIYLSAEAYQASETTEKDTSLGGYLSHEGNNVLRIVALICGGFKHLVEISKELRVLTYVEHPESFEVSINNQGNNLTPEK